MYHLPVPQSSFSLLIEVTLSPVLTVLFFYAGRIRLKSKITDNGQDIGDPIICKTNIFLLVYDVQNSSEAHLAPSEMAVGHT